MHLFLVVLPYAGCAAFCLARHQRMSSRTGRCAHPDNTNDLAALRSQIAELGAAQVIVERSRAYGVRP